jgi:hypothetical protein
MRIDFAELDVMHARARKERAEAVHGLISELVNWIVSRVARVRSGRVAPCRS